MAIFYKSKTARYQALEARAWARAWAKYPRRDCATSQACREAFVDADRRVLRFVRNV